MDFDQMVAVMLKMSGRAQATLMNRYISMIGPSLCRTIIRYCSTRLEKINMELPDDHPRKIREVQFQIDRKQTATEAYG
jgi:hypothetical protein